MRGAGFEPAKLNRASGLQPDWGPSPQPPQKVPEGGVEPPPRYRDQILSLARLPTSPPGHKEGGEPALQSTNLIRDFKYGHGNEEAPSRGPGGGFSEVDLFDLRQVHPPVPNKLERSQLEEDRVLE
jgi:hypothetical protein